MNFPSFFKKYVIKLKFLVNIWIGIVLNFFGSNGS